MPKYMRLIATFPFCYAAVLIGYAAILILLVRSSVSLSVRLLLTRKQKSAGKTKISVNVPCRISNQFVNFQLQMYRIKLAGGEILEKNSLYFAYTRMRMRWQCKSIFLNST